MKSVSSVYILSSSTGVLYVGVTTDLTGRVWEHKNNIFPNSFTSKYQCNKLVLYEDYNSVLGAIDREKQLKKWTRSKKELLITEMNPKWEDLSKSWW